MFDLQDTMHNKLQTQDKKNKQAYAFPALVSRYLTGNIPVQPDEKTPIVAANAINLKRLTGIMMDL